MCVGGCVSVWVCECVCRWVGRRVYVSEGVCECVCRWVGVCVYVSEGVCEWGMGMLYHAISLSNCLLWLCESHWLVLFDS